MKLESVIVLGASSDIGMELLTQLDGEAELIVAHGFQNIERLKAHAASSRSRLLPLAADLGAAESVEGFIQAASAACPVPTAIVHLAAPRLHLSRFKDLSDADFRSELDTQLHGPRAILAHFVPAMAKAKQGKLCFLLSSVTLDERPSGMAPYVTAKFALLGLMQSLAAEFGPKGLQINALSPGMVDTAFLQHLHPTVVEAAAASQPGGRNATALEVARALKAMLSGMDDMNGANLPLKRS